MVEIGSKCFDLRLPESRNRSKWRHVTWFLIFIYDKNSKILKLTISWSSNSILIKRPPFNSSRHENSNDIYYISVAVILTELFHLEYLNLQSIISRSSDWISINRPPFDSSYREESKDMYYISVALILTELFRFEFYNKNLALFTLFQYSEMTRSFDHSKDCHNPLSLFLILCHLVISVIWF